MRECLVKESQKNICGNGREVSEKPKKMPCYTVTVCPLKKPINTEYIEDPLFGAPNPLHGVIPKQRDGRIRGRILPSNVDVLSSHQILGGAGLIYN